MGVDVNTNGSDFRLPKKNLDNAYKAVCALDYHKQVTHGWTMNADEKYNLLSIGEILEFVGFEFSNKRGDILDPSFCGRQREIDQFFETLAPYVDEGSYINWVGEFGDHWQWLFTGGMMRVLEGIITYSETPSE